MHSLIIEGDAGIAAALEIALQLQWPTGRVSWAPDSWAGLALFRQYRPDLTLLDLGLPQLGGREVFRLIRELAPDEPVVLMADSADLFPRLPGDHDPGPTGWLTKPFDHYEFLAAIRAVLHGTPPLHGLIQHAAGDPPLAWELGDEAREQAGYAPDLCLVSAG